MLKAVFPSVSVCSSPAHDSLRPHPVPASSHYLACVLPSPLLPVVFPQFVFLVLSQLSAFSCCSPSSKRPSFDSQHLQLVAALPTTSSPPTCGGHITVCPRVLAPYLLRSDFFPFQCIAPSLSASPQCRVCVSSSPFTVTCGQFLVACHSPRLVFS